MMKEILTEIHLTISTEILGLNFKGHLLKTEMHEWKNDYIFCFTAELPQFEAKDLIINGLWNRISQTGLCPVIFAHCAMRGSKC